MLLVFAMMFGLLACGASKPAETQASTEAPTEAPATTAVPTEAAAEVTPPRPVLWWLTCILKEADDKMLNTYTVIGRKSPRHLLWMLTANSVAERCGEYRPVRNASSSGIPEPRKRVRPGRKLWL